MFRERQENGIGTAEEAKRFLGEIKIAVDAQLQSFLKRKITEAGKIEPALVPIIEKVGDFVATGGKRLRPALFMAGYQGFGGESFKEALYTSMVVELVHAAVLVHDDIIDNSDLRRGNPTLHRQFAENGEEEFGRSLAILAGDTLVAYAIDVLGNSRLMDGQRGLTARRVFDRMCLEVGYGELMDMLASRNKDLSQTQIIRMMEYKSARYSVARPLKMGAVLAGATVKSSNILYEYGRHLGIAFQLQDDILGVFGDEEKFGKPIDSDIKEGKTTLLVLGTLDALRKDGREVELQRFLSILGNPALTPEDFEWVKSLMVETGSLVRAQKIVAERTQRALRILTHVEAFKPKQRMFLEGIAQYLMEREV